MTSVGHALPAGFERCGGTPLLSDSPSAVFAWLKNEGNRNKSIQDIICCMPQKFRNDYLIAHSSISAQSSHYMSPRVIFGNLETDGIMFSIATGSDSNLPQSNSIEIVTRQNGKLSFYDLEIKDSKKHLSGPNPETCVTCHGDVHDKSVEMRPIFDRFPWPRMTGFQSDNCPNRSQFMAKVTEKSFEAVRKSPRLSCLVPPGQPLPKTSANGFTFGRHNSNAMDFSLQTENNRRIVRDLKRNPDLPKLEAFLVGLAKGCIVYQNFDSQAKFLDLPQSWFPSSSDYQQLLNIDPGLKKLQTPDEFKNYTDVKIAAQEARVQHEESQFRKMSERLENSQIVQFDSAMGFIRCDTKTEDLKVARRKLSNLIKDIPVTAQKYIYDGVLKSLENGSEFGGSIELKDGLARWAIETRGTDTRNWDLSVKPNYSRSAIEAFKELPLGQKYQDVPDILFVSVDVFDRKSPSYDAKKVEKFTKMCSELKAISLGTETKPSTKPHFNNGVL